MSDSVEAAVEESKWKITFVIDRGENVSFVGSSDAEVARFKAELTDSVRQWIHVPLGEGGVDGHEMILRKRIIGFKVRRDGLVPFHV